ncbi:MAG: hypothetical protein FJZ01_25930 [Candidatus Sericytochromatia bacterium]|nr:hypothetical protein [Candidatus Tanganyikabacteria bacterium]
MSARHPATVAMAATLLLGAWGCAQADGLLRMAGFALPPGSAAVRPAASEPSAASPAEKPVAARVEAGQPEMLPAGTAQAGKGQVVLGVRWPPAPKSGYRAQVILDSATRVLFEIKQGATLVASTSVTRPSGATTSTASLELDAGTFKLEATAQAGPAGAPVTVATGSTNLTVVAGARTTASMSLDATVPDLAGQVAEP